MGEEAAACWSQNKLNQTSCEDQAWASPASVERQYTMGSLLTAITSFSKFTGKPGCKTAERPAVFTKQARVRDALPSAAPSPASRPAAAARQLAYACWHGGGCRPAG